MQFTHQESNFPTYLVVLLLLFILWGEEYPGAFNALVLILTTWEHRRVWNWVGGGTCDSSQLRPKAAPGSVPTVSQHFKVATNFAWSLKKGKSYAITNRLVQDIVRFSHKDPRSFRCQLHTPGSINIRDLRAVQNNVNCHGQVLYLS